MSKIIIRPAVLSDIGAISKTNREDLGYDYPFESAKSRMESILEDPSHFVLIAEVDDISAGYIHGQLYNCLYADRMIDILALAVASSYRRRGVASALIARLEEDAVKHGIHTVRLSSNVTRENAHKFYIARGYLSDKTSRIFHKNLHK